MKNFHFLLLIQVMGEEEGRGIEGEISFKLINYIFLFINQKDIIFN